jgi:hypothetical protein
LATDRAKITALHALSAFADNEFANQGIPFGHIALDTVVIELRVKGGIVDVTNWRVASNDVATAVTLHAVVDANLDLSSIEGCIRYRTTDSFAKREPQTNSLLQILGGAIGSDQMFNIRIAGRLGDKRLLSQVCGRSCSNSTADRTQTIAEWKSYQDLHHSLLLDGSMNRVVLL